MTTIAIQIYIERTQIMKLNIRAVIDESSLNSVLEKIDTSIGVEPQNIKWQVGDTVVTGNEIIIPIFAVGYKTTSPENQLSDEELRQVLEQLPLTRLSDLCAEQFHTDCYCHPILEIQPTTFPDGTPILHKQS